MKSLRLFWLFTALLLIDPAPSFAQGTTAPQAAQFQWALQAFPVTPDGRNSASVNVQATDSAGNLYGVVTHRGAVRLAGQVIASADTLRHYRLVKLGPQGQLLWSLPIECAAPFFTVNVHIDRQTNIYLSGYYNGALTVAGDTLAVASGQDYYVAKLNPTGAVQWTDHGGGGGKRFVWDLAVDGAGSVYLSGKFSTASRIAGTVYTPFDNNPRKENAFCLKYASDGALRWAKVGVTQDTTSASAAGQRGGQLGLDRAGNVYLLTYFNGTFSWGARRISAPDATARLGWMRLDSATGDCVREFSLRRDWRGTMTVDDDGYAYLYGNFASTLDLHGLTLTASNPTDPLYSAYLARYDSDGVLQWAKQLAASAATPLQDTTIATTYSITADQKGKVYLTGLYSGNVRLGANPLPLVHNPSLDLNGFLLAVDQQTGTAAWALNVGGPGTKFLFGVQVTAAGEVIFNGQSLGSSARDTVVLAGLSTLDATNTKDFVVRVVQRYNTLTGAAYLDANADGIQNATEGGFPNGLVVEVNPGEIPCAAPATTGRYDAYLGLLNTNYTASLPNPPPHYTVVAQGPATSAPFATFGTAAAGRSFALQPIAGQQDAQVFLTQVSATRPGYPVLYDLTYRNTGTVALLTGTVTLDADPRLTFTSASAAAATSSGSLRTWTYANLLPGETRRLRVVFGLPPTTPLGVLVTSTATVTPLAGDLLPLDNTSTASRIVTGSFDPNDIEVNHTLLSPGQVASGEWLEYTIRFQNHGTDTAFTVALHDSLPAHLLRLTSLRVLAASHACGYGVSATGQLLITFPGIRLPSQATNLVESDGFVRFKVQPRATLVPGDQIPNRAAIHFDYNEPMVTNTALTTIQTTLGLPGENGAADAVRVWPNPASGVLHVEVPNAEAGPLTLTLADALGRAVRTTPTTPTTTTTLDLSGLPAGLYVLRGVGAGAPFSRRVVVR